MSVLFLDSKCNKNFWLWWQLQDFIVTHVDILKSILPLTVSVGLMKGTVLLIMW
jgi:hypothetical protein